jgi:hypothetical protein
VQVDTTSAVKERGLGLRLIQRETRGDFFVMRATERTG